MSRLLHRLGRSTAAHPWRTISAWVLVAVGVFALAGSIGGTPQDNWNIPDARAQVGIDQLRAHTPGAGNATARVVVHTRDGAPVGPGVIAPLTRRLGQMDHAVSVSPPRLSADRDTALLTVEYDAPVTDPDLMGKLGPLDHAVAPTRAAGIQVELGGDLPDTAAAPMRGSGELIGIVAALLILVLAFGSVVGAGLPIVVALTGLAVGSAGITLLAATMDVSTSAPMVASMVGLGVGIDYALLLVTRFAEFLGAGHDKVESAGRAVATAGRSVVFASATVLVSLLGLKLAGLPTYDAFGFATAIAVVGVASAALTLVPALCGLAGRRLLPRRVRKQRAAKGSPLMERWATRVGRRPLAWALLAAVVMLTLAAPALTMRTWPQDSSAQPSDLTTRRAYDLVAAEFGPGANSPITFVTQGLGTPRSPRWPTRSRPGADIASVSPVVPSADRALSIFEAEPAFGPTDERTPALVDALRARRPAGGRDHRHHAVVRRHRRAVLHPAVGRGRLRGRGLHAAARPGVPIGRGPAQGGGDEPAVDRGGVRRAHRDLPVGLGRRACSASTTRCRCRAGCRSCCSPCCSACRWTTRSSCSRGSARTGWTPVTPAAASCAASSSTGRVISAAAAIMVAVFLGFASEVDVVVKQLGIGMAVAIALDATLVRMVLVPATMTMLGRWNWWMPSWLDRALPTIRAEVTDLEEPATTRTPVGV